MSALLIKLPGPEVTSWTQKNHQSFLFYAKNTANKQLRRITYCEKWKSSFTKNRKRDFRDLQLNFLLYESL